MSYDISKEASAPSAHRCSSWGRTGTRRLLRCVRRRPWGGGFGPNGRRRMAGDAFPRRRTTAHSATANQGTGGIEGRSMRTLSSPETRWRGRGARRRSRAAAIVFAGGKLLREGAAKFLTPGSSRLSCLTEEEEETTAQLQGQSPEFGVARSCGTTQSSGG